MTQIQMVEILIWNFAYRSLIFGDRDPNSRLFSFFLVGISVQVFSVNFYDFFYWHHLDIPDISRGFIWKKIVGKVSKNSLALFSLPTHFLPLSVCISPVGAPPIDIPDGRCETIFFFVVFILSLVWFFYKGHALVLVNPASCPSLKLALHTFYMEIKMFAILLCYALKEWYKSAFRNIWHNMWMVCYLFIMYKEIR